MSMRMPHVEGAHNLHQVCAGIPCQFSFPRATGAPEVIFFPRRTNTSNGLPNTPSSTVAGQAVPYPGHPFTAQAKG
jgi:hypothetical protein